MAASKKKKQKRHRSVLNLFLQKINDPTENPKRLYISSQGEMHCYPRGVGASPLEIEQFKNLILPFWLARFPGVGPPPLADNSEMSCVFYIISQRFGELPSPLVSVHGRHYFETKF